MINIDGGWIKLYRKLLDKAIWQTSTAEQKAILITILLLASHKENEWEWQGKRFTVRPGQFITSLPSLAKSAGVTVSKLRTALKRFENYEFLTDQSTATGRLISVVNWGIYQSDAEEDSRAFDRPLADQSQTLSRQLAPIKNGDNVKNVKKGEEVSKPPRAADKKFIPPTLDEVATYCIERNNSVDPERFIDFYTSKGWMVGKNKMKDWKSAVRTWEKGNNDNFKKEGGTTNAGNSGNTKKYGVTF